MSILPNDAQVIPSPLAEYDRLSAAAVRRYRVEIRWDAGEA